MLVAHSITLLTRVRVLISFTVGFAARCQISLPSCSTFLCCDQNRTRLADPAFLKDNYDLASIPTKGYADLVWANITDVRFVRLGSQELS